MSLTSLPPETLLEIGSHLNLSSLNALIQAGKLFAELLTPQLYDDGLRVTADLDASIGNREINVHGVLKRPVWHCMPVWSSPWVKNYVMEKHQYTYAVPDFPSPSEEFPLLPLTHALSIVGNFTMLRAIILGTKNPDPLDENRRTPLHWAAMLGHVETVQFLLDAGANILAEDKNGYSAVFTASMCSGTSTALSLVIEATRKAGGDVMKPDAVRATPLHAAASIGNSLTTMCLIVEGADPLATADNGHVPAAEAITWGHDEVALLLIRSMVAFGGNLSLPGVHGHTLLHRAARFSGPDVVRSLLDAGADVSAVNDDGQTPLDIALERPESDEIIDLLLEQSTQTPIPDHTRTRMFDDVLIAGNLDRVQTLLRKCPPPWPQAHINSLLWQAAAQAPKYEHRQCNLIMQLARTGSSALTFSDSGGWSALHYLCSVRPTGSAAARDMIQLLINEGMPLNGKNHAGLTPLHRAIYTKNRVPIQLLLRACCTRQGRANIPDFEPAIDSLMKLEVNVSSLVMDRDGFTAIDRAVIKFKDEKVRTVFGALLGWPDDN